MADFNFKIESTIKELNLENANGEVVKTYSIDVGEREQTRNWIKEINQLQSIGQKFSEDEKAIDEMVEMEKRVINAILGVGSFDELFKLFNSNVFITLKFVKNLSVQLNEWLGEFYKEYV